MQDQCNDCTDTLSDHVQCEMCEIYMCDEMDKHDVPWGWLCIDCFDSQYGTPV